MTTIAVTGHQDLDGPTALLIERLMLEHLRAADALTGLSALAAGADQLFARCVLRCGGRLVAVVPAVDYASGFSPPEAFAYGELLGVAAEVVRLPHEHAGEQAYWDAGKEVVDRCDELLAVWDGEPSAGLGGTGDVVRYARQLGRRVTVLWPEGATRA
jgi:hypothetical protein